MARDLGKEVWEGAGLQKALLALQGWLGHPHEAIRWDLR